MEEFELEPGEQVMRTVRKHWLVFVASLIPFAFLAWLPTFFPDLIGFVERFSTNDTGLALLFSLSNPWFRLIVGLWWLLLWIGAFNAFTNYFLNSWVITSHRVVEIRQYGFFSRRVSSFLLARVQDVTTTVDGFFADIVGYGCVQVETAGEASQGFKMAYVADPQGMRDLIMREIALLHQPHEPPSGGV